LVPQPLGARQLFGERPAQNALTTNCGLMAMRQKLVALRNIPLTISVRGMDVRGTILFLYPNDIKVAISSPVSGQEKQLHIPYFSMRLHRLTSDRDGTAVITEYGWKLAEQLLTELFESSRT
jgi:hypothetical protein